jgi:hypothetical protein
MVRANMRSTPTLGALLVIFLSPIFLSDSVLVGVFRSQ